MTPPRVAPIYIQYGGRGAIQLSYHYNYTFISIELFNDYRIVRYPNLLITTDRDTWNGFPLMFGFPGPNPDGRNKLPDYIARTTPPARILAWMLSLVFWMKPRSGRWMSCHTAMQKPFEYGITTANQIVNNQTGCAWNKPYDYMNKTHRDTIYKQLNWASKKNVYYIRICKILGFDIDTIKRSIVCPSRNPMIRNGVNVIESVN
jgi:hypothetical protein